MFVKYSDKEYRFNCGINEYNLTIDNKTYVIIGNSRLYMELNSWGFYSNFYIDSDCGNHYNILTYKYSLEELVDLFNKQIQDSYNVGGKHYIESERKIENLSQNQ